MGFGLSSVRNHLIYCDAQQMAIRCVIVDDNKQLLETPRSILSRNGLIVSTGGASTEKCTEASRPRISRSSTFTRSRASSGASRAKLASSMSSGRSPRGRQGRRSSVRSSLGRGSGSHRSYETAWVSHRQVLRFCGQFYGRRRTGFL